MTVLYIVLAVMVIALVFPFLDFFLSLVVMLPLMLIGGLWNFGIAVTEKIKERRQFRPGTQKGR